MLPSLVFSKSACLRILPFATKIECIRIYRNTIQVTYWTKNGRCSTFLSKAAFFENFVSSRYESAKSVTVKRWSPATYQNRFDCRSPGGENVRVVDLSYGIPACSCPDFEQQCQVLKEARIGCKHIIATLRHIGFGSLHEYLSAKQREREKILAAREEEARRSLFAS